MASVKEKILKVLVRCNPAAGFPNRARGGRVWGRGETLAEITETVLSSLKEDTAHFLVDVLDDAKFKDERKRLNIPPSREEILAKENAELRESVAKGAKALEELGELKALLTKSGVLKGN